MRLFALALGLAAGLALAQYTPSYVTWTEAQAGTRAEPTLATQGLALSNAASSGATGVVRSFHGSVTCSDGSNFTAGSANCRFFSPSTQTWTTCSTGSYTLTTGQPQSIGPELQVTNPFGRVLYKLTGAVCNGGSWDGGVTVAIEGAL